MNIATSPEVLASAPDIARVGKTIYPWTVRFHPHPPHARTLSLTMRSQPCTVLDRPLLSVEGGRVWGLRVGKGVIDLNSVQVTEQCRRFVAPPRCATAHSAGRRRAGV
jgi:hypothetical protein